MLARWSISPGITRQEVRRQTRTDRHRRHHLLPECPLRRRVLDVLAAATMGSTSWSLSTLAWRGGSATASAIEHSRILSSAHCGTTLCQLNYKLKCHKLFA